MRWTVWASAGSALVAAAVGVGAAAPQADAYAVEQIASGVYTAVPTRPPGTLPQTTNLFIVNDDDVVVVDTSPSPALTRSALEALRRITDKRVTAVINTHGHDDHVFGNAVYRAAFPDVDVVAHAATEDRIRANRGERRPLDGQLPIEQLLRMISSNTGLLGEPLSARARAGLLADVAQSSTYTQPVSPEQLRITVPVTEPLVLTRGSRTIEVRPAGRAHSASDLLVSLPAERIVAVGDLAGLPFPCVDAQNSDLMAWVRQLDAVLASDPKVIVAGHGGIVARSVVEVERDLLRAIAQQSVAAAAQGKDLAATMSALDLRAFRSAFVGADPFLDALFENQFLTAAVRAARRTR